MVRPRKSRCAMSLQTQPNGTPQWALPSATATSRIVAALQAHGSTVKQTGTNKYQAQCPAHDDRTPSLSVTGIKDSVLLHCQAGCATVDVLAEVSLVMADLFDNPKGTSYEYRDATGRLTRTVHRSPEKKFWQNVMIKGINPLYNLAAVTEAVKAGEPILISEGEKDVHAAESLGLTATTAPGGASNWAQADYGPLRGAKVHIIADRDEAGYKRAAGLFRHLKNEIGVGSVDVLAAAQGKDLADHIAAGYSMDELVPIPPDELNTINHPAAKPVQEPLQRYQERRKAVLTAASQIRSVRQRWALDGVIPLGTPTTFAGQGGEGKTTFALHLAAQITTGKLDGDLYGQPHNVIIISTEDDWAAVTKPRLLAAGADLDRVYKLDVASTYDEITRETVPRFPLDAELIGEAIRETGAKGLICDPAPGLMTGDMNKVQDVRQAFEPLALLAQKGDLALILINHFGKGSGNVSTKLSGSHAWRDLTRSYLAFATDPETGHRVFSQDKNNYAEGKGSYQFTLESVAVPTDDGDTANVARVNYLGPTDVTVGEIINRTLKEGGEDDDRNAAQQFIVDFLRGRESLEASAGDIIKAGRRSGFSEMELKNARRRSKDPRILTTKSSFDAGWVWTLNEGASQHSTKVAKVSVSDALTPSSPSPAPSPVEHTDPILNPGTLSEQANQVRESLYALPSAAGRCPIHGTPMFQGICGRCEAGL